MISCTFILTMQSFSFLFLLDQGHFAFVQFKERSSAQQALHKRHFFHGYALTVRQKEVKPIAPRRVEDDSKDKSVVDHDRIIDAMLHCATVSLYLFRLDRLMTYALLTFGIYIICT